MADVVAVQAFRCASEPGVPVHGLPLWKVRKQSVPLWLRDVESAVHREGAKVRPHELSLLGWEGTELVAVVRGVAAPGTGSLYIQFTAVAVGHHRRGYASEGLGRLLTWAADANPDVSSLAVHAHVHRQNVASLGLLAKFDFAFVKAEQDGYELWSATFDIA